jgi:hypothetical protein
MLHTAKNTPWLPLVLLAVLQAGCLSESDSIEMAGKCGPRDLTPECCLKQNPGQWEQCTGSTKVVEAAKTSHSVATKVVAAGVAVAVASQPRINSAEHRGTELAADLRLRVEKAIGHRENSTKKPSM